MSNKGYVEITFQLIAEAIGLPKEVEIQEMQIDRKSETVTLFLASDKETKVTKLVREAESIKQFALDF